jgi:hypothetical protein
MKPGHGPRIIATAGELAAAAAAVEPDTPVTIEPEELEPGADPQQDDTWVVLAEAVAVPARDDGTPAGPGEPIGIHEHVDGHGQTHRHLAATTILTLRSRHLAAPGVIGPTATPADPALRRADAAEDPDDDQTRYLMELADLVIELRDELQHGHANHRFAGPAWRRLRQAADALDAAIGHLGAAAPYGRTCGLVKADFVDDDQPCMPESFDETFVFVPNEGYDECGCPRHAAAVLATDPEARITRITVDARPVLLGLLPTGYELPPDAAGPPRAT